VTLSATGPASGTVLLRDARWTDVPALTALEGQVFPDDAWSERSWWAELAGRPRRDYVVAARDDGTVLGYGGLDHGGDVADVMTVVVAPAGRGRGLGRQLLAALEQRAVRRGEQHLMLEVRADNAAALGLYAAEGYVPLRTRRGYYPGGVDALVMRKSLTENGTGEGDADG
jgi:ribosomal-protein-alanine N-acetyltransferase